MYSAYGTIYVYKCHYKIDRNVLQIKKDWFYAFTKSYNIWYKFILHIKVLNYEIE